MDLVNQYLRAVAALLPRAKREDITAELRDIILSRIEAREAALGRRLGDEEVEEELRAVGHPILVAARYRDEPQHLVGPSLYPYWMFAVKIAIAIQIVAALFGLVIRTINTADFGQALGHAIGQVVTGSVTLIGVATVVAWLIERRKIHLGTLDQWRVRDLKVLEYAGWDFTDLCNHFRQAGDHAREQARERTRSPRAAAAQEPWDMRWHPRRRSPIGQGIFAVVFGTVFLLWWTGVIPLAVFAPERVQHHLAANLLTGTVAGLNLDDLHAMVFWPVLFYAMAVIVQGSLTLAFPAAIRFRSFIAILMGIALLSFCAWIWMVSPIAAAIRVDNVTDFVQRAKDSLHDGLPLALAPTLTLALACTAFGAAINIVQGLWTMLVPSWEV